MDETYRSPEDYLGRPYARVLTPDDESSTYTAEILEFPGCIAQGDTPEEAYGNLESAAAGWIEAALGMGQRIPEPSDSYSYSGRIALRLPRGLHRRAAQMAERDGTSLNQFLVAAIAERVGASSLYERMAQKLEQLSRTVVQTAINDMVKTVASWPPPPRGVNLTSMLGNESIVLGNEAIVELPLLSKTVPALGRGTPASTMLVWQGSQEEQVETNG